MPHRRRQYLVKQRRVLPAIRLTATLPCLRRCLPVRTSDRRFTLRSTVACTHCYYRVRALCNRTRGDVRAKNDRRVRRAARRRTGRAQHSTAATRRPYTHIPTRTRSCPRTRPAAHAGAATQACVRVHEHSSRSAACRYRACHRPREHSAFSAAWYGLRMILNFRLSCRGDAHTAPANACRSSTSS